MASLRVVAGASYGALVHESKTNRKNLPPVRSSELWRPENRHTGVDHPVQDIACYRDLGLLRVGLPSTQPVGLGFQAAMASSEIQSMRSPDGRGRGRTEPSWRRDSWSCSSGAPVSSLPNHDTSVFRVPFRSAKLRLTEYDSCTNAAHDRESPKFLVEFRSSEFRNTTTVGTSRAIRTRHRISSAQFRICASLQPCCSAALRSTSSLWADERTNCTDSS
ncbi:MAG: hypothetical protein ACI8TX_003751 [Hyphomicrobiaceae bacterium]|jgi:hypothetical protein